MNLDAEWYRFMKQFPFPIADIVRAEVVEAPNPEVQAAGLIRVAETVLQYAALVGVADYVRHDLRDEAVTYRFQRLKRPLLSDFVQFLQTAVPVLRTGRRPWSLALDDALTRCRRQEVSVLRVGEQGVEEKKMPLLDGVVHLRNAFVHRRWGGHWQLFVKHHAESVLSLLRAMSWMSDFPLFVRKGAHEWLVLSGSTPPFPSVEMADPGIPEEARVVLGDPQHTAFLPLEPWMSWMECPLCRKDGTDGLGAELFLFNGEDGLYRVAYVGSRHACSLREPFPKIRDFFLQASASLPVLHVQDAPYLVLYERALRHTRTWLDRQRMTGRYIPEVYQSRPDLEAALEAFLNSPASGFLLVGDAGIGKTALLSYMTHQWCDRGEVVLAYDGTDFLAGVPPEAQILKDLALAGELAELLTGLQQEGRRLVVPVDGLDQAPHRTELLRQFRSLILRHRNRPLKVILACRPWTLDALIRAERPETGPAEVLRVEATLFPPEAFYSRDLVGPGQRLTTARWTLGRLPTDRLASLYEAYRRYTGPPDGVGPEARFRPKTAFPATTPQVRLWLAHPAYLRWLLETYDGRPLPGDIDAEDVLRAMAGPVAPGRSETERAALASVIERWFRRMAEKRSVVLDERDVESILPPPEDSWRPARDRPPGQTLTRLGLWQIGEGTGDPAAPRYIVPGSAWFVEHGLAARSLPTPPQGPAPGHAEFPTWPSPEDPAWEPWMGATALVLAASLRAGRSELYQEVLRSMPPETADAMTLRIVHILDGWGDDKTVDTVLQVLRSDPDPARARSIGSRLALEARMQGYEARSEKIEVWIRHAQGPATLPDTPRPPQDEAGPPAPDVGASAQAPGGLIAVESEDKIIYGPGEQGDEVYYCGRCRRQQRPAEGERCKVCGAITVSWFPRREDADEAHRRWEQLFGPVEREPVPGARPPGAALAPIGPGGAGMAQVFVDPDQLEAFAARLAAFSKETDEIRQVLRGSLQNLGATWRDQEYEQFMQAFVRLERVLIELAREIQEVHPKILADVRFIREYQQIKP